MPANPRVSVIVPTYNQAEYLGHAIRSVLQQTFVDWELIVVDDGSTDETTQCMAQFTDSRVRYVFQQHQERSCARNRGIGEARGALVAFLDADDFWLPAYLETQVATMDACSNAGLSYTWHYNADVTGQLVEVHGYGASGAQNRDEFLRAMLLGNRMISNSVVVRASVLEEVGVFDPEIVHVEDWDLWLRIAMAHRVVVVAEPLACYRRYNVFMPARLIGRNADQGSIRVIEKAFEQLQGSPMFELREVALAEAHWRSAWLRFAIRDLETGRSRMTDARDLCASLFAPPYTRFIESVGYLADELYDIGTPLDAALACINQFFDNLPDWAQPLCRLRKRALGQYCGLHVFRSYGRGNRLGVLQAGVLAARYKPSWFLNRGFSAIVGRALLSPARYRPLSLLAPHRAHG